MGNQDVLIAVAKVLAKALLITFAYGLPALVAVHRRHDRSEAIALLNLKRSELNKSNPNQT